VVSPVCGTTRLESHDLTPSNVTGVEIDPFSEVLYKSHADKIAKMEKWESSPFRLMKVEKKAGAFMLKPTATKVDCSSCVIGGANKQCKKLLCKNCRIADNTIAKCGAHGKKPDVPSSGATSAREAVSTTATAEV